MKTNIHILPAICILCFCACKSGNASSLNKNDVIQDTIKTFTLPAIPNDDSPGTTADFLVKHYWDNVNFADTNYIHHPEVTEQAWADYCDILNHVPLETAQEAMRKTIEQTNVDKKVFTYITDLADKYLYDPNSPMRNEEFYIPVLDAMLASPLLEEIEKVRPKARRELAQKKPYRNQSPELQLHISFRRTRLPLSTASRLYPPIHQQPRLSCLHRNNRCPEKRTYHQPTFGTKETNSPLYLP